MAKQLNGLVMHEATKRAASDVDGLCAEISVAATKEARGERMRSLEYAAGRLPWPAEVTADLAFVRQKLTALLSRMTGESMGEITNRYAARAGDE